MVKIYKFNFLANARLYAKCSLVFLLLALLYACKPHDQKLILAWKDGQAIGLQIPGSALKDASESRVAQSIKVIVEGSTNTNGILGSFTKNDGGYNFEPVIPLTNGLTYLVLLNGNLIDKIKVPAFLDNQPTELLAFYPMEDTVPENLLKFYLFFSKPVRSGESLKYISLLDKNRDTMRNVFLDLQPELWDRSGTVLTLWLDPGRIKRGLVLNQKLGNPLKKNESYELVVSNQWKDVHGNQIHIRASKQFFVGARDEKRPDVAGWQTNSPKAGTTDTLKVNTNEKLDRRLLPDCLTITDGEKNLVNGNIIVTGNSRQWVFKPSLPWKTGTYKIRVKAVLEDLAGNNLNRVFDRDITKDKQLDRQYYYKQFIVK